MFIRRNRNLSLFAIIIGLILFFPPVLRAQNSPVANQGLNIRTQTQPASIEDKKINLPSQKSGKSDESGAGIKSFSVFSTTTLALGFVVAIILALAWVLRKTGPGGRILFGSLPMLKFLGKTHISPKQSIGMVKLEHRLILIGITEHQITHLLTIDDPDEVSRITSGVEQNRSSSITSTFKGMFSHETDNLNESREADIQEKKSDKKSENDILNLKNDINMLLNKVEKLKGKGS